MEQAEDLVVLGKITKPHGIRGEVKVYPYSGTPENLLRYTTVLLDSTVDAQAGQLSFHVERARVQKNCVLMQLTGCTTRSAAESLVGRQIYVHEQDLPAPADDEFYLRDLEGKQMVTAEGAPIGTVTGIMIAKGQDLILLKNGTREYLIPLVADFLVAIDEETVTVALPPGLLDINL